MSDILDFIIKNFGQLRPTDYVVLGIFGSLVAGASFFALRWLFKSRFQAQKELLELQAQTVNALNSHLDLTKQERDELRSALEEKMRRLDEMERKVATSSDIEKAAIREEALVIISRSLVAYLHREVLARSSLYLFMQVAAEAPPADAVSLLDNFSKRVNLIRELFEKTTSQEHRDSLQELGGLAYSKDTAEIAYRVFERFQILNNEIIAKANALENGSRRLG